MRSYSRHKGLFDPDSRNSSVQSMWLGTLLKSCWFVNTACCGLIPIVSKGFSFLSSHGEKHLNPKSGWEVDPDKPGSTMSCLGGETDPTFRTLVFWILFPVPDPAPVEHPHKVKCSETVENY